MLDLAMQRIKSLGFIESLSDMYRKVKEFFTIIYLLLTGQNFDDFVKLIKKLKDYKKVKSRVDVENIRHVDGYFDTYDDIFEDIKYRIDYLEVDFKKWAETEVDFSEISEHVTLIHVANILENMIFIDVNKIIEEKTGIKQYEQEIYYDKLLDKDMGDIRNEYPELYIELSEIAHDQFKENGYYELIDSGFFELYGIDYPEERFNQHEALAYWTVYFEPPYFDEDIAHKCGLLPFEYYHETRGNMQLLALGGCGMDLSPRLDAYQALVSKSLSSSNRFEDDQDYAEYVVGKDLYKEVLESAKKSPTIKINTY